MSDTTPIFLFSDPGIDDSLAIALIAKSKQFSVLGGCGVGGNVSSARAAKNLHYLFNLFDIKAPVFRGKHVKQHFAVDTTKIHGKIGLGSLELPDSSTKNTSSSKMADYILDCPSKVKILSMGPLTDIPQFLQDNPKLKSKIDEIIVMGGGIKKGNITQHAEFNIYCNPEAAKEFFQKDYRIKIIPLDVTELVKLNYSDLDVILKSSHEMKIIGKMLKFYFKFHEKHEGFQGCYVHDPLTVCSILWPKLIKFKKCNVDVVTDTQSAYGKTIIEFDDSNRFVNIGVGINHEETKSKILECLIHN